jgi:hypothetical protein
VEDLYVDLAPWLRQLPGIPRKKIERRSSMSLIGGFLLVALAAVGTVFRIADVGVRAELVGALLVMGVGAVMVWSGLRLRTALRRDDSDPVSFVTPYAFRVGGGEIHFPAGFTSSPQTWPLAETTVVATSNQLEFRAPGRRTRRFPAKSFVLPTTAIRTAVESYRGDPPLG